MTRKKFIKECMAKGISRNRARKEAGKLVHWNEEAARKNKRAEEREWEAILRFLNGEKSVNLDPIRREPMIGYQDLWYGIPVLAK